MSSGLETAEIIEPWLYATLSGDAALAEMVGGRVVGALTPDELASPYVTFALSSPRDVMGVGTARLMVEALYIVKAVAQTTSQDDVAPIAGRIEALLHGRSASVATGHVLAVSRRNVISYPEVSRGIPFLHAGGLYRIQAHS